MSELYAADYLSKMFQHVFYLPNISACEKYLNFLMPGSILLEKEEWIRIILEYNLLPSNPRKIKSFVSGLAFYAEQLQKRLDVYNKDKADGEKIKLDKPLALIFAYLRLMSNDIYRILEAEPDFWNILLNFCQNPRQNEHWALKKLISPETAADSTMESGYEYTSAYADPSDEGLFRAGRLIREWQGGSPPLEDELSLYLMREIS